MSVTRAQIEALLMRVQNEFLATPALELPVREASQRFGLEIESCKAILDALVDAHVLRVTSEGVYARLVPRGPFAATTRAQAA